MNDLISRQDAIDALADYIHNVDKVIGTGCLSPNDCKDAATNVIAGLPSAQPESIRCKDCVHAKPWYRDKAMCFLWHETGIDVFNDGFCNYAERRTDD